MTPHALLITVALICQGLIVAGQTLLKQSIGAGQKPAGAGADAGMAPWRRALPKFSMAIACLTVWFFLWLGLMSRWDLSLLFPFEGLNPALMAMSAALILKERMPLAAWAGLGLICVGIAIVAGS